MLSAISHIYVLTRRVQIPTHETTIDSSFSWTRIKRSFGGRETDTHIVRLGWKKLFLNICFVRLWNMCVLVLFFSYFTISLHWWMPRARPTKDADLIAIWIGLRVLCWVVHITTTQCAVWSEISKRLFGRNRNRGSKNNDMLHTKSSFCSLFFLFFFLNTTSHFCVWRIKGHRAVAIDLNVWKVWHSWKIGHNNHSYKTFSNTQSDCDTNRHKSSSSFDGMWRGHAISCLEIILIDP